ncbi:MAG: type II toxin-antitoxin system RelE/ParE family toxin [Thermodesulfobacteriota bacterium]
MKYRLVYTILHFLGEYRFRIGDYRVIFDIEGNEIIVLRVGQTNQVQSWQTFLSIENYTNTASLDDPLPH